MPLALAHALLLAAAGANITKVKTKGGVYQGAPRGQTARDQPGNLSASADWRCPTKAVPGSYGPCPPASPTPSDDNDCGFIIWKPLAVVSLHQAFAYAKNYAFEGNPSLAINSGYYGCSNDGNDHCTTGSACSSGHDDEILNGTQPRATCYGVNCGDDAAGYSVLSSSNGLSSVSPDESSRSCWMLDPTTECMWPEALWQAEQTVQKSWDVCQNPKAPLYSLLSHNCRYYVQAVMAEYCKIAPGTPGTSVCAC